MRFLWLVLAVVASRGWAINWSATLESKVQVDNRIEDRANVSGEVWGDIHFFSLADKLGLHLTAVSRLSKGPIDSGVQLYQGYIEKAFELIPLAVKLGRMQRADATGFYALDGGAAEYRLKSWRWEWYAGVPRRFDLLRSVSGDSVFGTGISYRKRFHFPNDFLTLSRSNWHVGVQRYLDDQSAWRLLGTWNGDGKIASRLYLTGAVLNYRLDKQRLENVGFNLTVDVSDSIRWRSDYEFYQPLPELLTFRERFLSAYALKEQSLFRSELHHRPHSKWHYVLSGRRTTRGDGQDGYGMRAGMEFDLGDTRWGLVYDHLDFGKEQADSGYWGVRVLFNSHLDGRFNFAVRREEKALYGVNWVRGGEVGSQLIVNSKLALIVSFFYIANLKMRDDYVGAVRLIYHLDRFQPKTESLACIIFC